MSLEWKDVVLKDVLSEKGYIRGPFGSALKRSKMKSEGIPVYEQQNAIYDNRIFRYYIDDEKYQSLKRFTTLPNDLIISCSGTVGKVSIIKENDPKGIISQALLTLRVNNELIHPEFLKYFFTSYEGYNSLVSRSTGSVQVNISKRAVIEEIPIKLPPLDIQEKIVYYLKLIDKKIEVNEGINKNLEKTLITIFNSWFINFENYDNSKGMKIDDSYGEIPVDWSVEMLEDYVDFVTGVEPGSKNYHEKPEPNDIPFLRVGDLGSRDNGVFIDPSLSKNKILKYDDIVLSLDATIGIVKMGLEGAYSTGMRKLVIKNDNINQPFLYCLVKSNRIQRIIETFATGTTILHAGKSIKHMNFVLSDKKTMDDFGKIGNPIISIILTNLKEIEYLTNLRDTLLPKLMSGEIDVSKINCDLKIIIRKIYIKSSKLFLWRYLSENQNHIKNTKSNETLLKSRTIHKINKFLAKFNARYRYYRQ